MEISVTAAKGQLTELVRRAEAGEQIVLTRHGKPAARLTSITTPAEAERRRKFLAEIRMASASARTFLHRAAAGSSRMMAIKAEVSTAITPAGRHRRRGSRHYRF